MWGCPWSPPDENVRAVGGCHAQLKDYDRRQSWTTRWQRYTMYKLFPPLPRCFFVYVAMSVCSYHTQQCSQPQCRGVQREKRDQEEASTDLKVNETAVERMTKSTEKKNRQRKQRGTD